MKNLLVPLFALSFFAAGCGNKVTAESSDHSQSLPKTKIGAFEKQSGIVVLRAFSKVGDIRAMYGGIVTIESIEFTNATSGAKEYGIIFDVAESDTLKRSNRSLIDYDEIDSLLTGIDYISKVDRSSTKLDDFQVEYRTKDGLLFSVFSTSSKDIIASIVSGSIGSTQIFLQKGDLPKLRQLITDAQSILNTLKNS